MRGSLRALALVAIGVLLVARDVPAQSSGDPGSGDIVMLDFTISMLQDQLWSFHGLISGGNPANMQVLLRGIIPNTWVPVNANGYFEHIREVPPPTSGVVYARAYTIGDHSNELMDILNQP